MNSTKLKNIIKKINLLLRSSIILLIVSTSVILAGKSYAATVTPSEFDVYMVHFFELPVVSYDGRTKGYEATKPGKGQKINGKSEKVTKYSNYLKNKQLKTLNSIGISTDNIIYQLTIANNAIAVQATHEQAEQIADIPGVISVEPVTIMEPNMHRSPYALGATSPLSAPAPDGALTLRDYMVNGARLAGEDVVIGLIDSGIWPEHEVFSADAYGSSYSSDPNRCANTGLGCFTGTGCFLDTQDYPFPVPNDENARCNNKILTANYFFGTFWKKGMRPGFENTIFAPLGGKDFIPSARNNRDSSHGTGTASLALGNEIPNAINLPIEANLGEVSGIAPRARLAGYRVVGDGGGLLSDGSAGLDQAISDGVDVISMSLGALYPQAALNNGGPYSDNATTDSLLLAVENNIPVSISAGNNFPDFRNIGLFNNSAAAPWALAVGNAATDQEYIGTATLVRDNNTTLEVKGLYAGKAINEGELITTTTGDPMACSSNLVDQLASQSSLEGKILVCNSVIDTIPFYNKILDNKAFVIQLLNQTFILGYRQFTLGSQPNLIVYNNENNDRQNVIDYLKNNVDRKASISQGQIEPTNTQIFLTLEGPLKSYPNIIKPDLVAFGHNSVAAIAAGSPQYGAFDNTNYVANFGGTSASAPIVAGAMALVKQAHPDWTAAMIKSALMTTTRQTYLNINSGQQEPIMSDRTGQPATPFQMGSGLLDLNGFKDQIKGSVIDPGLVYDIPDVIAYLEHICHPKTIVSKKLCQRYGINNSKIDPSELNLPSLAISELVGKKTVTRTVKNVSSTGAINWHFTISQPPDFDIIVRSNDAND
ncbi:MAG: S8 family serine peptidase, partial [Candidatus Berkiella sp.]